jgi:hypothetical protein
MIRNTAQCHTGGRGAPRSRQCYICGRETLLAGYPWHVAQCKDLFLKREVLKPKAERRPLPPDPMLSLRQEQVDAYHKQAEQATLTPCHSDWSSVSLHHPKCCSRGEPPAPPPTTAIHSGHAAYVKPRARANAASRRGDFFHTSHLRQHKSTRHVHFQEDETKAPSPDPHSDPSPDRPLKPTAPLENLSFDGYEQNNVPAVMVKCPHCGRQFSEEAFAHHAHVCKSVFGQRRKPYDSSEHRIVGTDMEMFAPKKLFGKIAMTAGGDEDGIGSRNSMSKSEARWRSQSVAFREAIRTAREATAAERHAEAAGKPLSTVLPQADVSSPDDPAYDDYVQCPHCGRKFNQAAAFKHIPKCKYTFARPSRLKKGTGHVATSTGY